MNFFAGEDPEGRPERASTAQPTRMPRWSLALPEQVRQVHTAYFGVQRHSPADASMRAADRAEAAIHRVLAGSGAAVEWFEVMAGHDMPGARVQVACWNDVDAAARSLAGLDLAALHVSLGEWRDSIGLWGEAFTTQVSRLETEYVGPDPLRHRPGLAGLPQVLASLASHSDRLDVAPGSTSMQAVSDDAFGDAFDPNLPPVVPFGYGEIISGWNLSELVHVRSGHEASDCGDVESELRERGLRVLIDLGLDWLWSHPVEAGAYGLRQLLRIDADKRPLADIGFAGFMRSRADFERWNAEVAAHMADFQRLLDQEGLSAGQRRLRTYQEVSILEPGDARFEYVNCGPRTGAIRFVDLGCARLRVRHDLS